MLETWDGIEPERLFWLKSRRDWAGECVPTEEENLQGSEIGEGECLTLTRLEQEPSFSGIEPNRKFFRRIRTLSWFEAHSLSGMVPVSLFEDKSSSCSCWFLPRFSGIMPVQKLEILQAVELKWDFPTLRDFAIKEVPTQVQVLELLQAQNAKGQESCEVIVRLEAAHILNLDFTGEVVAIEMELCQPIQASNFRGNRAIQPHTRQNNRNDSAMGAFDSTPRTN
nr:hypothetical protein Iba_chr06aCG3400 [Ipomoea batatas]